MSRTYYDDISLTKLIESADYIFVVEKSDPFITTKNRSIHWNVLKYKPYQQTIYHFKVIETLYSQNKDGLPRDIAVLPANSERDFFIYKKYELEGIRKSPIYERYVTGCDFNKEDKLIVFLRRIGPENGFELYCEEAAEILKTIKKKDI